MAKNNGPNGRILSSPCLCGRSCLIILGSPITKRTTPLKYSQNTFAGMEKTASASAGRAWWRNWKQFNIFIPGSLSPGSDSQRPQPTLDHRPTPVGLRNPFQRGCKGIERERAQQVPAQSALDFAETLRGALHPG